MTVRDVVDRLSANTVVCVHDRSSEAGTVYKGTVLEMKTIWHDRLVVWIKVYDHELVLEVE